MKKCNKGFSLTELMVSVVIASLMSISVISIYANQTGNLMAESQRDASTLEANRAYDLVSRLLKQAPVNGLTLGATSDSLSITFDLPAGFDVWPNNVSPFANNTVTLTWNNTSNDQNQYLIRLSNANLPEDITLAGDNTGSDARIVDMKVWPMLSQFAEATLIGDSANSGYLLSITTRGANPDDGTRFRTHTVSGIVSPRN